MISHNCSVNPNFMRRESSSMLIRNTSQIQTTRILINILREFRSIFSSNTYVARGIFDYIQQTSPRPAMDSKLNGTIKHLIFTLTMKSSKYLAMTLRRAFTLIYLWNRNQGQFYIHCVMNPVGNLFQTQKSHHLHNVSIRSMI